MNIESKRIINYYNSKDKQKINKVTKIIINNAEHSRKTNEDTFLKEYIKSHNEKKQKKLIYKNYYLLNGKNRENNNIIHSNIHSNNKKSSSLISFSPRINNKNGKIEYIVNPKKIEINKIKPFHYNLINNNSKRNLLLNHNENKINYQQYKKNSNSFRINYAKKLNYLDKKFLQKKIIGFNFNESQKIMKRYINSIISSSNNNSDSYGLNKTNNIYVKKLFDPNVSKIKKDTKISTNIPRKEESFNFNRNIFKFKLSGNSSNNMLYYNYSSNSYGFNFNTNKKNTERIYSARDHKNLGNKTFKYDKRIAINNYKGNNRKYKSCSDNKNRIPLNNVM